MHYIFLQREHRTVRHTFTLSHQNFSHDFIAVGHHHPRLAHAQAVHVSMCLCQLGMDVTGEGQNRRNVEQRQMRWDWFRST